jgi:lactate dehydrogenase-like 2-hydroxyacid dehydrogenase
MSVKDVKVTVYSSQQVGCDHQLEIHLRFSVLPLLSPRHICLQYVRDFMTKPMADAFPSTVFVEPALDAVTASLAKGSDAVVLFVNDPAPADVIHALADNGVKMIAMRCAGFDRVDLEACAARGIKVARVPTYSPQSVAEHGKLGVPNPSLDT